jgi:hypothetical protein
MPSYHRATAAPTRGAQPAAPARPGRTSAAAAGATSAVAWPARSRRAPGGRNRAACRPTRHVVEPQVVDPGRLQRAVAAAAQRRVVDELALRPANTRSPASRPPAWSGSPRAGPGGRRGRGRGPLGARRRRRLARVGGSSPSSGIGKWLQIRWFDSLSSRRRPKVGVEGLAVGRADRPARRGRELDQTGSPWSRAGRMWARAADSDPLGEDPGLKLRRGRRRLDPQVDHQGAATLEVLPQRVARPACARVGEHQAPVCLFVGGIHLQ